MPTLAPKDDIHLRLQQIREPMRRQGVDLVERAGLVLFDRYTLAGGAPTNEVECCICEYENKRPLKTVIFNTDLHDPSGTYIQSIFVPALSEALMIYRRMRGLTNETGRYEAEYRAGLATGIVDRASPRQRSAPTASVGLQNTGRFRVGDRVRIAGTAFGNRRAGRVEVTEHTIVGIDGENIHIEPPLLHPASTIDLVRRPERDPDYRDLAIRQHEGRTSSDEINGLINMSREMLDRQAGFRSQEGTTVGVGGTRQVQSGPVSSASYLDLDTSRITSGMTLMILQDVPVGKMYIHENCVYINNADRRRVEADPRFGPLTPEQLAAIDRMPAPQLPPRTAPPPAENRTATDSIRMQQRQNEEQRRRRAQREAMVQPPPRQGQGLRGLRPGLIFFDEFVSRTVEKEMEKPEPLPEDLTKRHIRKKKDR